MTGQEEMLGPSQWMPTISEATAAGELVVVVGWTVGVEVEVGVEVDVDVEVEVAGLGLAEVDCWGVELEEGVFVEVEAPDWAGLFWTEVD